MDDIRNIRRQLGLTQAELADRLGLHQSTISRFEIGTLPLDDRTRLALEALLARNNRPERVDALPPVMEHSDTADWPIPSSGNGGDLSAPGPEADSPAPFPEGSAAGVDLPPTSSSTCPSCGASENPQTCLSSHGASEAMSEAAE